MNSDIMKELNEDNTDEEELLPAKAPSVLEVRKKDNVKQIKLNIGGKESALSNEREIHKPTTLRLKNLRDNNVPESFLVPMILRKTKMKGRQNPLQ